jgi:hypothetical protein
MHVGQNFRAVVGQFHEAAMGLLEEVHVVIHVHVEDRVAPMIVGFRLLEPQRIERSQQRSDAVGVLKGIDDTPMHHVLLGLVGQLGLGKEELHGSGSQTTGGSSCQTIRLQTLTFTLQQPYASGVGTSSSTRAAHERTPTSEARAHSCWTDQGQAPAASLRHGSESEQPRPPSHA